MKQNKLRTEKHDLNTMHWKFATNLRTPHMGALLPPQGFFLLTLSIHTQTDHFLLQSNIHSYHLLKYGLIITICHSTTLAFKGNNYS